MFESDISLSRDPGRAGRELVAHAVRDASDRIETEAESAAPGPRRAARAGPPPREPRAAGRRHRPRLQQPARRDPQLHDAARAPRVDEPVGRRATSARSGPPRSGPPALTRQLLTFARRDVVDPEPLEINGVVRGAAACSSAPSASTSSSASSSSTPPLVAVVRPPPARADHAEPRHQRPGRHARRRRADDHGHVDRAGPGDGSGRRRRADGDRRRARA